MTFHDGRRQNDTATLPVRESGLGALVAGLVAAGVLVLSLMAAMTIGVEESQLVVQVQPTATPTRGGMAVAMPASSATPTHRPTATSLPPTPLSTPSSTPEPAPTVAPSPTCAPPGSWRAYVVQAGESLAVLAARYRTTESALQRANCLSSPHLARGQVVYVPNVVATSTPCGHPSTWVRYIVKKGDTLSDLARRVAATVAALKKANCRSGDTIYVGEVLWVPRLPATPVPPTTRPTRTPSVTPSPTATGVTATPSPTASVTAEPTGSATPPATGSAVPTDTSVPPTGVVPSDTPPPTGVVPSDTPPPTDVVPSDTPPPPTGVAPTDTPRPTVAPSDTPRPTVAPSDTPRPTAVPTQPPKPTEALEPSPVPSDEP